MTTFHLNKIKIIFMMLLLVSVEKAIAECSVDQIGKMTGAGFTEQEIDKICNNPRMSNSPSPHKAHDPNNISGGYFVTFKETYNSIMEDMKRMDREMALMDQYHIPMMPLQMPFQQRGYQVYWNITQTGNAIKIAESSLGVGELDFDNFGLDTSNSTTSRMLGNEKKQLEIVKSILEKGSVKIRFRNKLQISDGSVVISTTSLALKPNMKDELEGSYSGPYEQVDQTYGSMYGMGPSKIQGIITLIPDLNEQTTNPAPVQRSRELDF